jgi:hypothetical protein
MKRFMLRATIAMALTFLLVTIVACKQKSVTAKRSVTASQGVTAKPAYSNLLTADDVAKVTGLSGVALVPPDVHKGAGGDLNFALPNGKMILLVSFLDTNGYNQSKKMEGVYGGEVTGVGDEAFIGKVMGMESILYFRKGARGAALSSFIDTDHGWPGKPYVSQPQLRQLAALMISRI